MPKFEGSTGSQKLATISNHSPTSQSQVLKVISTKEKKDISICAVLNLHINTVLTVLLRKNEDVPLSLCVCISQQPASQLCGIHSGEMIIGIHMAI